MKERGKEFKRRNGASCHGGLEDADAANHPVCRQKYASPRL